MVRCTLIVVAAVCVALVAADEAETIEKGKKLLQKCLTENGATNDDVKAFTNGQANPENKVKCMLKCFMQGNKAMKEDGTIDIERIVTFATEARRPTAAKCITGATSADLCEKAYQYESCFLANENEYFKATVGKLIA